MVCYRSLLMPRSILLLYIILGCAYSEKYDYEKLCKESSAWSKSKLCQKRFSTGTKDRSTTERTLLTTVKEITHGKIQEIVKPNNVDENAELASEFEHSAYRPRSRYGGSPVNIIQQSANRTLLTAEFNFALSLLNKLSVDKSCIVSPFSISLALSLVHSGTKGTARKEIEQLLLKGAANEEFSQHFSNLIGNISEVKNGVDFQLANRVFVRKSYPLLDSYLSSIRDNYKADAVSLDFGDKTGSAEAVNSFVSEVTQGKIEKIVTPDMIDSSLIMMIVNAVYMNAKWESEFEKKNTKQSTFYVSENVEKKVDFLQDYDVKRDYYENKQFQLLSLKYKDRRYRFNVILPKQKFGLGTIQTNLTGAEITEILYEKLKKTLLDVKLPRFKLETEIELTPILKSFGVKGIFSGGKDLTGFSGSDDLVVPQAIHKATIEVDEGGTIATAVTYAKMLTAMPDPPKPIDFIADHPFMFCITFDNHPIFIGKYYE